MSLDCSSGSATHGSEPCTRVISCAQGHRFKSHFTPLEGVGDMRLVIVVVRGRCVLFNLVSGKDLLCSGEIWVCRKTPLLPLRTSLISWGSNTQELFSPNHHASGIKMRYIMFGKPCFLQGFLHMFFPCCEKTVIQ